MQIIRLQSAAQDRARLVTQLVSALECWVQGSVGSSGGNEFWHKMAQILGISACAIVQLCILSQQSSGGPFTLFFPFAFPSYMKLKLYLPPVRCHSCA